MNTDNTNEKSNAAQADLWSTPHLAEAMRGRQAARFLATCDDAGQPYLTPALAVELQDDGLVHFAALQPAPIARNLDRHPSCALLVIDEHLHWWCIRLRFIGVRPGAAGSPVKAWGVLQPETLLLHGQYSGLRLIIEFIRTRTFGTAGAGDFPNPLPAEIARHLPTLKTIKGLAYLEVDGEPLALPCLSLTNAGPGALICPTGQVPRLREIPSGAPVAVCLLTFEPNAYQIHGCLLGQGRRVVIRIAGVHPAVPQ